MPELFGIEWNEHEEKQNQSVYRLERGGIPVKDELSGTGFSWISLDDFDLGQYRGEKEEYQGANVQVYDDNTVLRVPVTEEQESKDPDYDLFDFEKFYSKGSPE